MNIQSLLQCASVAVLGAFGSVHAQLAPEVVDLYREIEALPAAGETFELLIGEHAEDLLLRRVRVQIDDDAPLEYEYSAAETAALDNGGRHRLLRMPLPAGAHRLRVALISRHVDALPQTPRVDATVEYPFDKGDGPLTMDVSLVDRGWLRGVKPEVKTSAQPTAVQRSQLAQFAAGAQRGWLAALEGPQPSLPAPPSPAVTRYNEAVSMMRSGAQDAGMALLATLGTQDATDPGTRRVRDLANLTLGYQHLRQRRGEAAAEALRRVRSPGPYGNAALLGLGWSYLLPKAGASDADADAPGGWWPQDESDSADLRRRMPFRYNWSVAAGERADDLHDALVAWNELVGRDPLDPIVQEGMLVVPYALQHLGAHEQAQARYLRAVEQLQSARVQIDAALEQLHDGRFLAMVDAETGDGWRRWLADLPYDDGTAYTRILVERVEVLDALEARRPLRDQQRLLSTMQRMLDAQAATPRADALRQRVEAMQRQTAQQLAAADAALIAAAESALLARRDGTGAYLSEARFAIARLHDPSQRAIDRGVQRVASGAGP
ncbi:MAG: hypothetical protein VYC42_08150 [Pseudomonadota bacterium]|nr:hypothetical protein [Pseudomonadota bacterium]